MAARSATKAQEFASSHDIPHSFGSYDELLANPDVDVVYVGSVADQHDFLATKALMAGKPTVVEKPLTLGLDSTTKLIQLAQSKNTFLMYVCVCVAEA